jgi:O-antigen/teichoic acid export membrane protein
MVLFAPLVASVADAPKIEWVMIWLAPSALIAALTSWQEALMLRRKEVTAYYIIWLVAETASAGLAIGLFLLGVRVDALIAYRYSQVVLMSAGYTLHAGTVPRMRWHTGEARLAVAFASRLYGSRLSAVVSNYGADLIIGALTSPAAAGSYRLASRMVFGVAEIWFQPIKTIAWVRFSSAIRNHAGLDQEWMRLTMVLSMVACPALGCVAVLAGPLTNTVLGSAWIAAAPVVAILAVARAAGLFETFLDPLLATTGASHGLMLIRTAASVVTVAGLLCVARFGAAAAAWVQAVVGFALAAVTIGVGVRRTNVTARLLLETLLPGTATTVFCMLSVAGAVRLTEHFEWAPIAKLGCETGAGAVVWAIMTGVVFRQKALATVLKLRDQQILQAGGGG